LIELIAGGDSGTFPIFPVSIAEEVVTECAFYAVQGCEEGAFFG
jgi:hypothetical protein